MKETKIKFQSQRWRAQQRGITWKLTFEEWFEIWINSGYWDQRGRGANDYCMSRYGDIGAYEVGNVFIQTNAENIKQMWNNSGRDAHIENIRQSAFNRQPRSQETREKNRQANLGRILGPVEQVSCPHCDKQGGINAMKRWHMDNCKQKEYAT